MSEAPFSLSISGGAAHGVVASGALTALADRGLIPQAVSGISSGIIAALLAYGSDSRDQQIAFWEEAFAMVHEKRRLRTFIPPFDSSGVSTIERLLPLAFSPQSYRERGMRSIWAGVTRLPLMRFEKHNLAQCADTEELVLQAMRSSMMPFLTHDSVHVRRGLDGAFANNHFVPPGAPTQRWLMTYANKPLTSGRGGRGEYTKVILLKSPFRTALHFDGRRIVRAWEEGYSQGRAVDVLRG